LKRRELSDKKKEERWVEAKKKQEENEVKRKERIAEKEKADAQIKRKGKKRKAETPITVQATSDGAVKDTSSSFSLTQDRLRHCHKPHVPKLAMVAPINLCVFNLSVGSLDGSEDSPEFVAFNDLILLLEKIR